MITKYNLPGLANGRVVFLLIGSFRYIRCFCKDVNLVKYDFICRLHYSICSLGREESTRDTFELKTVYLEKTAIENKK